MREDDTARPTDEVDQVSIAATVVTMVSSSKTASQKRKRGGFDGDCFPALAGSWPSSTETVRFASVEQKRRVL